MNKLYVVRLDFKNSFTIHAGESARGIRLMLKYTKGLDIKNFIKIENELFETPVKNITDDSVDILFPSLEVGTYQAEIVISENEEILKSGTYTIIVNESIVTGESKKLKSVNADEILMRLSKIEEEYKTKLKDLNLMQSGTYDKNYEHIQLESSDIWRVTHNLNKYPAVSVIDSAGTEVYGDVTYISKDELVLNFSCAFSGTAVLN